MPQADEGEYTVYDASQIDKRGGFDVISDRLFIGNYKRLAEAKAVCEFLNAHLPRRPAPARKSRGGPAIKNWGPPVQGADYFCQNSACIDYGVGFSESGLCPSCGQELSFIPDGD